MGSDDGQSDYLYSFGGRSETHAMALMIAMEVFVVAKFVGRKTNQGLIFDALFFSCDLSSVKGTRIRR